MIYAVEYTVGFGYFGILSNLSAASIQIDVNSNRTNKEISCLVRKCFLLGYADATVREGTAERVFCFLLGYADATVIDLPVSFMCGILVSYNLRRYE